MYSAALLPFVITGCAAAVALLLYRTPLDLQVLLEQHDGPARIAATAQWSFLAVRGVMCEGSASLSLCISGKVVVEQLISPTPGVRPGEQRPGAALDLGLLRYSPGIARIARALIRHLAIRKIEGNIMLGLRNPADTGIIYGFFSAVRPLIQMDKRVSLSLQPAFDREVFTGRLTADLRIERPLVIPVLVFTCILLPGRFRMIREYSSGSRVIAA